MLYRDSHAFRGYGTIVARDWYMELPNAIRHIVDEAGFGIFCMGLSRLTASQPLLGALVERWWDTTDSFHFSTVGEMTMTPFDFSMLTGIGWDAAQIYLLGTRPHLFQPGMVRYSWFADYFRGETPMTREETEYYARGFLMFPFGTTLFADWANTVGLYLLSALVDLSQLWVYAYFPRLVPEPEVKTPPMVPYSHRYDVRCQWRPREFFSFFRRYFDTVAAAEITWQPWAVMPDGVRDQFAGAWETGERDRPVAAAERAGGSRARRGAGWPELPTTVTYRGRAGETYQIPIAPTPAGHALVGVRGPTPAPIEYTEQALELSASLMGMIPFQMPVPSGAPAGVAVGPSAPPPAAGREGRGASVRSRGRDGRTHTESSSRGLIPDDDESDEDEELASPKSVSSQGGDDAGDSSEEGSGDGSGSDPGSGVDGGAGGDSSEAMPMKKAKTASRS
ncbi:hypothetical protein CsSME_00008156 [Camellia sinensis var. sinensis]